MRTVGRISMESFGRIMLVLAFGLAAGLLYLVFTSITF